MDAQELNFKMQLYPKVIVRGKKKKKKRNNGLYFCYYFQKVELRNNILRKRKKCFEFYEKKPTTNGR